MNPVIEHQTDARSSDPLAKILLERRLLPRAELERWQAEASARRIFLEDVLLENNVLSRTELIQALENQFFCPSYDVNNAPYAPDLLRRLPHGLAKKQLALPIEDTGEEVKVVMANPQDQKARNAVALTLSRLIAPCVALRGELRDKIEELYKRHERELAGGKAGKAEKSDADSDEREDDGTEAKASEAPVFAAEDLRLKDTSELVDMLIHEAELRGATDIHFEPAKNSFGVRFRVDGILTRAVTLSRNLHAQMISRIKILAEMNIAEHRVPLDGSFTVTRSDSLIDIRVSTLPSQYGEKAVLRLLVKNLNLLDLERLEMPRPVRDPYQQALDAPQGLFLVTGPTGSGKTTTLYATLKALDRASINVITLEDPIEYTLPDVTQVQIREDQGMSFARGLRAILRQDPDVILVGEIRDLETVEIACRAALTGHKVFSTLHTNSSAEAITRLIDMGVAPFLIAATLRGVLAQRLVRVNCKHCLESYAPTEAELAMLGYPRIDHLHRGAGCKYCGNTGYKGRKALYEYTSVDSNLHRDIMQNAPSHVLHRTATKNGMIPMSDFARREVIEGGTTVAEIRRTVMAEEGRELLCPTCSRLVNAEFTVCPHCQARLREVCPGCGAQIDSSWEACPNCGHEIRREWQQLYCRNCFAPVQADWDACPYCNTEIAT
ncbi:Flp pilus assembly complex ATPase component TadA [Candidatus Sumerlaeota bacterium]|nr:Flp pilus assembly complex ATPase component TadA [Candidatus Sumerlaeota bacterium]